MKSRKIRRPPLFNPLTIAIKLSQALALDLDDVRPINPEPWEHFKNSQKCLLKKFSSVGETEKAKLRQVAAIQKFLDVAGHVTAFAFVPPLPLGELRMRQNIDAYDLVLWRARHLAAEILGDLDLTEVFQASKHGPGTSQGVRYNDSGNSAKWVLPLSCTPRCSPLIDLYFKWDGSLQESFLYAYPDLSFQDGLKQHLKLVTSSRLTTVPKTSEIDRTIAIEPTANMFLQQGLGAIIAKRLVSYGIDIQVQQDRHREMAWLASVTRKFATIDFSSASDCVGTNLLQWLLPPAWFNVIDMVRCDSVTIVDGEVIPLGCIATMGNATTFVLETLVFFCLGLAVTSLSDGTRSAFVRYEDFRDRVSVFGDDCIVPTQDAPLFIEVCKAVGFLVNDDKSFIEASDPFRESCGADYFQGYNVRPFFLKGPRSMKPSVLRAWLYAVWNGLIKKLISSFGDLTYVYRSRALAYMAQEISRYNKEIYVVPTTDPDDSGCKFYGDSLRLSRLFSVRFARITRDKHGSIVYYRLNSGAPPEGTYTAALELWYWLKFPQTREVAVRHLPLPESPVGFTVRKMDRGYVVCTGRIFAGANVGIPFGVSQPA